MAVQMFGTVSVVDPFAETLLQVVFSLVCKDVLVKCWPRSRHFAAGLREDTAFKHLITLAVLEAFSTSCQAADAAGV